MAGTSPAMTQCVTHRRAGIDTIDGDEGARASMSMRSRERHARLLDALTAGEIDVDDLARRFSVSASTVRRDLQHLSKTNAVHRTYGGAILTSHAHETTLEQRLAVQGK